MKRSFKLISFTAILSLGIFLSPAFSNAITLTLQVPSGADDVLLVGTSFYPAIANFQAGPQGGLIHGSAARFTNVTIPRGATINNAYLTLNARASVSAVPVNTKIFAENSDNAIQIANATDFNSRLLTTGTDWDISGAWTAGTDYPSFNIASEIQTVVNRAGWSVNGGNAINIFWKDDGSANNYYRQANSFEGSSVNSPRLFIDYTVAGGGDTTPPVRSNGSPTGTLAAGTAQTNISLTTDENATCRYSAITGTPYSLMTNFSTTGGTSHSATVTGLSNGNTYYYYVRCQDTLGNTNTTDFPISFSVASAGGGSMTFNLIADITTEETGLGMVEYNDNLYIAAHTDPKNNGPGTIIRYNDITGTYGTAYNIPSGQGLGDIRVLNSRIYVTSIDFDGNNAGWIYNGSTWQQWTMSGPAGLFDIDYYNGRYYVAGYTGSATLYSSLDGSTNWTQFYTQQYVGDPSIQYISRFTQIAAFSGKMFFTPQVSNDPTTYSMEGRPTTSMYFPYEIFSYDGTNFTPIEFSTAVTQVTDMEVFNNALYLSIWSSSTSVAGMWRTTDGVNFSQVSFFGPSPSKTPKLSELVIYNNRLYVAEFNTSSVLLYESLDGTNWNQVATIPATGSAYGTGSWYNHTALGVYRGKLYAIPPAQGRLFVSTVAADTTPPARSNGQPAGTLAAGTAQTNISLNTDEPANCRYSTIPDTPYSLMNYNFLTTGGTSHSTLVAGLANGITYNYYVRCQDTLGNPNTTDSLITFFVTIWGDISSPTPGIRDGKVDIYDVSRLLSKWESTLPADLAEADINSGPGNISQDRIDLYDANLMMRNWNP